MTEIKTRLSVALQQPFDFRATAYSHGWVVLAPNVWRDHEEVVDTVIQLRSSLVVQVSISSGGRPEAPRLRIIVRSERELRPRDRQDIKRRIMRMFRASEDLSEFYELCALRGAPWDRLIHGAGRLLRSPSLFEDLVKTICTTNIQWAGTKSMVTNLVDYFGKAYPLDDGLKAFPTAAALAAASLSDLAQARLGYRAGYISELARRVASGELVLDKLEDPSLKSIELRKRLLSIKGVGNYAAGTLLMLLGHYDFLAYDTVMRDFVAEKYYNGRRPSEKEALSIYEDWGKWRYLAYWFDLIADEPD